VNTLFKENIMDGSLSIAPAHSLATILRASKSLQEFESCPSHEIREILEQQLTEHLPQLMPGCNHSRVGLDLQHLGIRLSHCTLTFSSEGPECPATYLASLCGSVIVATDGKNVVAYDPPRERYRVLKPVHEDRAGARFSLCTHHQVPSVIVDFLNQTHANRRTLSASYVDGFLGLWDHGTGTLLFRGAAASKRDMRPYLRASEALGFKLAQVGDLGLTEKSAEQLLTEIQDHANLHGSTLYMVAHPALIPAMSDYYEDIRVGCV
jgi:hypothetical protein